MRRFMAVVLMVAVLAVASVAGAAPNGGINPFQHGSILPW